MAGDPAAAPPGAHPGEAARAPQVSVILSTYNRPDALQRAVEGYGRSTFRSFELIVADDGSGPDTRALVERLARRAAFPLRHVWQPDEGFRLAAIRNAAVRAARGAILLFTDGDCVPLDGLLEAHASSCRPGIAVAGGRCWLSGAQTDLVLASTEGAQAVGPRVRRAAWPGLRLERLKGRLHRLLHLKPRPRLTTANASVHRDDVLRVNGFDERFEGWGYEDEDLARRLRRVGVRIVDRTLEALVLHLFHPVHPSHRPSARGTPNYRTFLRSLFLTRPLLGLVRRSVEELDLEVVGDAPPALRSLQATSLSVPELSIVFPGASQGQRRERRRGQRWGAAPRAPALRIGAADRVKTLADLLALLSRELQEGPGDGVAKAAAARPHRR